MLYCTYALTELQLNIQNSISFTVWVCTIFKTQVLKICIDSASRAHKKNLPTKDRRTT